MAPVLHGDRGNYLAPVKYSIKKIRQYTEEDWKNTAWSNECCLLLQCANVESEFDVKFMNPEIHPACDGWFSWPTIFSLALQNTI